MKSFEELYLEFCRLQGIDSKDEKYAGWSKSDILKFFNLVKSSLPYIEEPVEPTCVYCKEGVTDEYPMLFRVNAPGMYFQHWNWRREGCAANPRNIPPSGDK